MPIASRNKWIRDEDGFVWRGYRIRREPRRRSGWEVILAESIDESADTTSPVTLHSRSLDQAFEVVDTIETSRIRRMKLRTYSIIGAASLGIVLASAYSWTSLFEYLIWVALLVVGAEALLRAATILFWDEWGWMGPQLTFDEANALDRLLARLAHRMRSKAPPEVPNRIRVAR